MGQLVGGRSGSDQVLEEGAEGGPGIVGCGEPVGLSRELHHGLREHRVDEGGLGGEMAMDRAGAHAGQPGNLVERGLEAALGEGLPGGGDHLLAVGEGVGPQWPGSRLAAIGP